MPGFLETPRFPDQVAAWAIGGAGFYTTVVQTYGGDEFRNGAWSQPLGVWTFIEVLRSQGVDFDRARYTFSTLRNFHRISRGMLGAFRFRDYNDYQDEGKGIFVAIDSTHFQMYKLYDEIENVTTTETDTQIIQKPQPADVASDYPGIVIAGGGTYDLDYTTGIVTKTGGSDPTGWIGNFDKPVRLDVDDQKLGPISNGAFRQWEALRLVEIRLRELEP